MRTVLLIAESIGLVVGSLAAGILLCWLLWMLFRIVRHPAWGPPLVAAPAILALTGQLPESEFLDMALIFAVVAAAPFWVAGRSWRRNRDGNDMPGLGGRRGLGAGVGLAPPAQS